MTITANLADGRVLSFPDGTDPAVIQATVRKMIQPQQPVEQLQTEPQSDPSIGQQALGVAENIGSLIGSAIAEPVAGITGLAAELMPGGRTGAEQVEFIRGQAQELTGPRTETGQAQQQALGGAISQAGQSITENVLEPLGVDNLAEKTLDVTGSPLAATAVASLPTAIGEAVGLKGLSSLSRSSNKAMNIINEAAPDQVKKSFTKKLGNDRFEPRIFGMVKEARKQGFDDSVTTLIANASATDKRKMLQQLSIVKKGKGDARAKALTRTADVAGDALVKKIDFIKSNNKQAGQQLNRVAKGLKGKDVDIKGSIDNFINDLDELGVTLDEKGKPNFEGSQIEGVAPAESLINKIALRIKRNPAPDALEAHQFKKFIDENVAFGKTAAEGLSGKTEGIVKSLRSGVNESIGSISDSYRQANKQFSDTITALDDLQDVAGRKLDFSGPNADKAAGVLLRSQTNNTKGRANLLTAIKNLEDTAQKYGGSFDDDILNLSIFSDELDAVFGSGARTSLRGEVGKANIDAAVDLSQMTIPGAVAVGVKAGAKKLRGVNEANQLKAIEKLLKSK